LSAVAPPAVTTIRAAIAEAVAMLEAAGVPTPRVNAEWLLAGTLGVGRARLGLEADTPLTPRMAHAFGIAVRRRTAREPLQQILGWEEFRGLRLRITPDVLVPRPETEMLVEWAISLLPAAGDRRLRVADVGTGSGCIACALARARADLDLLAIDVSAAAARIAADNARTLISGARVVVADALTAVRHGALDAIIANPPYLTDAELRVLAPEIARYEPRLALAGGVDGRQILDALVDDAARGLRPGGVLVVETGGPSHVSALGVRLRAHGFEGIATHADLAGVVRFVAARRAQDATA
jgi:release factor glutamine methyltransferase